MPWIDCIPPQYPDNLHLEGNMITWDSGETSCELDKQRFFVLYHFDKKADQFLKSAGNIIEITGESFVKFDEKLDP